MKFKKGDNVVVIAGNDRGQTGSVLEVQRGRDRVVVEGVNLRTKNIKPTQSNPKGERVQREFPIHASNVQFVDGAGKRTRKRPQEA